jgi:hypothetical protein
MITAHSSTALSSIYQTIQCYLSEDHNQQQNDFDQILKIINTHTMMTATPLTVQGSGLRNKDVCGAYKIKG